MAADIDSGTTMEVWQAFMLGLMVAYTPSLIFLAVTLFHEPDEDAGAVIQR